MFYQWVPAMLCEWTPAVLAQLSTTSPDIERVAFEVDPATPGSSKFFQSVDAVLDTHRLGKLKTVHFQLTLAGPAITETEAEIHKYLPELASRGILSICAVGPSSVTRGD